MNIEDLSLELKPGFTVISGPSNSGKTGLLKALSSLFYNKHSDTRVMNGKDSYIIGVKDENTVMTKRNPSKGAKTTYNVNGENLVKVGRGSIEEVEKATQIKEVEILQQKVALNFFYQFSYPFLLDRTPSQLYEFLASSESSNSLNDIVKQMKSDLKDISDNQKRLEGQIDMVKSSRDKEKVRISNLKGSDILITSIFNKSGEIQNQDYLSSVIESLQVMERDKLEKESQLQSIKSRENILSNIEDTYLEAVELERLKSICEEINQDSVNLNIQKDFIKMVDSLNLEGINKLEDSYNKACNLFTTLSELHTLSNSLGCDYRNLELMEESFKVISKTDQELNLLLEAVGKFIGYRDIFNSIVGYGYALKIHKTELQNLNNLELEVDNELSTFDNCPLCGSSMK